MLSGKLKYKVQRTRTINLARGVLHERITNQLKEYSYQQVAVVDHTVTFSSGYTSRLELARRSGTKLTEGTFELDNLDSITIVKLTYFINYTGFLFVLGAVLIYMLFEDVFAGFMLIFLFIGFAVYIFLQKAAAKELMEIILK
jgi:hypothetical protein